MGLGGWGNWRVNPVRGSVSCVGNRGFREWLAEPAAHRSSLRNGWGFEI